MTLSVNTNHPEFDQYDDPSLWEEGKVDLYALTCDHCGMVKSQTGPDPCWGLIPDVVQACCGHGYRFTRYIVVAPGYEPDTPSSSIPFDDAVVFRQGYVDQILPYLTAPFQNG